ncbi:hypothetical protein nbrc107696_04190 [Gordonia spumicola]|uniref:Uncharacterized protein n=2 Tax=Gordonia spumicola TaxID=589161 RepID=A0A7I9V464_9ACTN|nr:hypothetical protein nbrc107696_04190 [Gordonia spumicola]
MDSETVGELGYRQDAEPEDWNLRETLLISLTVLLPETLRRPLLAGLLAFSILVYSVIALVDPVYGFVGLGITASLVIAVPLIGVVASRRMLKTGGSQELIFREHGFSYIGPHSDKFPPEIAYTEVTVLRRYKRATVMRTRYLNGGPLIAEPELMPQEAYNRVYRGMRRG